MAHCSNNHTGKKRPNHKRPSKLESQRLRQCILQDLKAGFKIFQIMERNNCSRSTVELVQKQHQDELQEHIHERLAERQEQIDHFLEQEERDIMQIISMTSAALKAALEKRLAMASGEFLPVEIKERFDGKWIKSKPADDLETAMAAWEKAHLAFVRLHQRTEG